MEIEDGQYYFTMGECCSFPENKCEQWPNNISLVSVLCWYFSVVWDYGLIQIKEIVMQNIQSRMRRLSVFCRYSFVSKF
jgi:hypothetical protein